MASEDKISSYIDLVALRAETDAALKEIQRLRDARDEISKAKAEIKVAVSSNEVVSSQNAAAAATRNATKAQQEATKAVIENEKAIQAKIKTDRDALKLQNDKVKADQSEQKIQAQLSDERALLTKALKDQEKNYANLYLTQGKNNELTKAARKEVLQTRAVLDDLNHSIGNYQSNVGNYASAFTGYANILRGLRGPTKLLGEALGIGAQEADQFRIVIEHSLQGIAAFFRAKENKAKATAEETAATTANTAATAANTAAEEANVKAKGKSKRQKSAVDGPRLFIEDPIPEEVIASTSAEAVAAGELATAEGAVAATSAEATVATEGLAVAEAEAAIATKGLATAFTGGLYAAIAGIVAVVGVAIKYFYDMFTQEKRIEEAQKAVAESAKNVSEGLKKQLADYENINSIRRRGLEDELSSAEKSGASQEKIFAIKKKIAEFDKFNNTVIVSASEVNNEKLNETIGNYEKARDRVEFFNREILKSQKIQADNAKLGTFTPGAPFEDVDKLKKQQELAIAQRDQLASQKEYEQSILEKNANATRALNDLTNEEAKFSADERRKITLEYTKFETDLIKSKNDKILSDERSTLQERFAAIRSNLSAQKTLLEAEKNNVLNDPSASKADRLIAIKNAATEETKAKLDANRLIYEADMENYNRILKAQKETDDLRLQESSKADEQIFSNQYESLQKRIQAQYDYSKTQKSLINSDYNYQKNLLDQKASTDEEYKLLEANKDAKLVQLAFDSQKKITDIYKSAAAEQQQVQENFYKFILQNNSSDLDSAEKYNADVQALNAALQNKTISLKKYESERSDIEDSFAQRRLESTIAKERAIIAEKSRVGEGTIDDQLKLEELLAQQNEKKNKKDLDDVKALEAAKKHLHAEEARLAQESINLVQTLFTSSIENQKNELAKVQRLKDEGYSRELENIRSSSLSEQDKANATIQLQAKQAADKKAYDQKQKDLDIKKAQFEKAANIAKVIAATAAAEVEALSYLTNPLTAALYPAIAATIGAIGAVQLAAIISQPIPKYAKGVDNLQQAGLGIFGEAGPEQVSIPGKPSFIANTPTIGYLPRGTTITPIGTDELNSVMYRSMIIQTAGQGQNENNALMKELISTIKSSKQQVGINVSGNRQFQEWQVWVKNNTSW